MMFDIELEGFPKERIEAEHRELAWDAYKVKHLRPVVNGIVEPIRPETVPTITLVDTQEG